jgi:hypothetical protein
MSIIQQNPTHHWRLQAFSSSGVFRRPPSSTVTRKLGRASTSADICLYLSATVLCSAVLWLSRAVSNGRQWCRCQRHQQYQLPSDPPLLFPLSRCGGSKVEALAARPSRADVRIGVGGNIVFISASRDPLFHSAKHHRPHSAATTLK